MTLTLVLELFLILCFGLAFAGTVSHGGKCSISNNRLDNVTHKFLTDCDDTTFCASQNSCQPKQCRRDEFPFGYPKDAVLPPLCPHGQYCPDEGNACLPWVALGQACQLNRDDECAPPPITSKMGGHQMETNLQSPMKIGKSLSPIDVSICLHFTCMYANVTLGASCTTDTTVYSGLGPKGTQVSTVVTRDNCRRPGLFCNASVCVQSLKLGQPCQRDQECLSFNCNVRNVCANPPTTPLAVPVWQYVLTGLAVFIAMIMTCIILIIVHRRHRQQRYAETREYYREQLGYRKSIIALHSLAASHTSYFDGKHDSSFDSTRAANLHEGYIENKTKLIKDKRSD